MDRVDPTPSRLGRSDVSLWDDDARSLLDEYLETQPFLVRISAAKRLRERIEREARRELEARVGAARVSAVLSTALEEQRT